MINASIYDMGFTINKIQMSENNVKWMNGQMVGHIVQKTGELDCICLTTTHVLQDILAKDWWADGWVDG